MSKEYTPEEDADHMEKVLTFSAAHGREWEHMQWLVETYSIFTMHSLVEAGGEIRIPMSAIQASSEKGCLVGARIEDTDDGGAELVLKDLTDWEDDQ